ncbi:cyclase family protein [Pseudorhodoferax sp.]|uniref:cyclase family protein n=1 Tax=Pseudorhodoferax sp. TaxID=1993553 RepID=UPI002DD6453E|nr:cyclase family protein [Pseudorhodoferax sp.]
MSDQKPRWQQRPEGSNWGDFGADDQLGRMNLVTPECVRRAAREVREGLSFCLSLPLDYPGGNKLNVRRHPPSYRPTADGSVQYYNYRVATQTPGHTDVISDDAVTLHTQYSTQWDSFAHVGSAFDADGDGVAETVYYNGWRGGLHILGPQDPGGMGARRLGVEHMAVKAVQTRGAMVDLFRLHGRTRGFVGYDALMRALEHDRVELQSGDILCLYTGFADLVMEMGGDPDPAQLHNACAVLDGRDTRLLQWIADSGIAALAADNYAVEGLPARSGALPCAAAPLHELCLFKQGIALGELWLLGPLARWLRSHARCHFMLTAPPLRLPGAVGSPLTPVGTV